MKTNGGFLVTKLKQLGDRIFEKILSEKNIDAFNGAQGRILYVLDIYRSAGASLFGVRVIARILLAAPAISIEPLVR